MTAVAHGELFEITDRAAAAASAVCFLLCVVAAPLPLCSWPMSSLFIAAIVAVVVIAAVAVVLYRMTRRDPPGHYDRKPPHPGFRSNRGRGR